MSNRPISDTTQLQCMNTLLETALAMPPELREAWLQSLPAEQAALAPPLRALLRRAAAEGDTFMRRPAASID